MTIIQRYMPQIVFGLTLFLIGAVLFSVTVAPAFAQSAVKLLTGVSPNPIIVVMPTTVYKNTGQNFVTMTGTGFTPNKEVDWVIVDPTGTTAGGVTSDANGNIAITDSRIGFGPLPLGQYSVYAVDVTTNTKSNMFTITVASYSNPPTFSVSPTTFTQGQSITLTGSHFTANGPTEICDRLPSGVNICDKIGNADSNGNLNAAYVVLTDFPFTCTTITGCSVCAVSGGVTYCSGQTTLAIYDLNAGVFSNGIQVIILQGSAQQTASTSATTSSTSSLQTSTSLSATQTTTSSTASSSNSIYQAATSSQTSSSSQTTSITSTTSTTIQTQTSTFAITQVSSIASTSSTTIVNSMTVTQTQTLSSTTTTTPNVAGALQASLGPASILLMIIGGLTVGFPFLRKR